MEDRRSMRPKKTAVDKQYVKVMELEKQKPDTASGPSADCLLFTKISSEMVSEWWLSRRHC